MCASYRATREERHSTRGRARLLFEMLRGEVIGRRGWRDEALKEALDLCLSCKGCKGECPVHVDIATYKAEFLSHYYARRLRPRAAYAFALIHWWARLGSRAPRLANLVAGRRTARWLMGAAPERRLPSLAPRTFVAWFRRRAVRDGGGRPVVLLPDTFSNHFHPERGRAAVTALEAAGFEIRLPDSALCCGRPLYDWGMLDLAKRQLRRILRVLREPLREGLPVVVLEPSCLAVFRDELPDLLPQDPDAGRLRDRAVSIAELLGGAGEFPWPKISRRALVHLHCHHRAVIGHQADEEFLERLGLDVAIVDAGCCGMAGAFGYERGERYEVAMKVGESALLPAVRAASPETLILADGFSCQEQIAQATGRRPLHLAEVLALALDPQEGPRPREG